MPLTLTDADILARLTAVEDGTTERKPYADFRGWTKTVVAFSNSLNEDQPGVLFVGVNDNGTIQDEGKNFADLQKKVSGELSNIYPPVNSTILVREKDGKEFLAVIVYGSSNKPHFAGKSYVRDGTQTLEASEAQFDGLIAKRSSKVAKILEWIGKEITYHTPQIVQFDAALNTNTRKTTQILHDCNQYWVSLKGLGNSPKLTSFQLRQVELNYDHANSRLMLDVYLG